MHSHQIKVLGRELRVKSAAPPEVVREIEGFVNSQLAAISGSVKGGDSQLVAILALMTIAESYLSLLKEQSSAQVTQRLQSLLAKVDKHL